MSAAWALLASGADLSNEVGVKHWLRDALTYDDQSDTFSTNALSGVAASAALETSAAALPVLMDEATESLREDLEPMQARLAIEAQRPVVMITGAAGLDNALDRENLTMAVVSNEWTVAADGSRHLDCYVFSNKILMSPPIVDAALMTDLGTVTNWVRGVWDGYGTRACTVELEHQNAYTNFVIVSRTYGESKVLETNVTLVVTAYDQVVTTNNFSSSVEVQDIVTNYVSKTYSYTQTLTLTNAVLITIDGQQPQVTLRGDKEYFECYRLCFDLPPAESVRLNPWVKIGHPETGFDFGNRQLRINGAMTVTTNDVSEIGEWFTPDGNRVELTPYLDQGLLRFSDLKEDEE